jgi:hypothetical protein
MPLLPLLQAIPLHIESARNNIKEILLTMKEHRNPDITSISDRPPQTGKRFSPTLYSDGPLSSPADTSVGHKRPRIEFEAVPAIDPQTGLNPFRSPLSATLPTHGQHIPIAAFPIQQQVPQTPHRRPLGDLLTPTNDTRANYPLSNSISSQGRKPSLASIPSPPVFHAFTPPKQRSPRTPTLISTELHFTNKEPEAPIHVNSLFSSSVSHIQQAVPKSKTLPSTSGPARFPTPSIQTTLQAQTSSNMPRPTKPPTPPDVQTSWLDRTSSKQPPSSSDTKDKSSVRSSSRIGGEGAPTRNDGDDPGTNLKEPAPKVKPMSIKDRQASFVSPPFVCCRVGLTLMRCYSLEARP